jgi:pimeloyl-ACP methyl ester carboxylesterase
MSRFFPLLLTLAATLIGGGGCAGSLGGFVVQSPNGGTPNSARTLVDPAVRAQNGVDRFYLLDVGPPAAELGVLQKEPLAIYGQPRGTILVLHGLGGESLWMMHFADKFAEDGYRVFLIDSRGHGASTGKHVTYGALESQDVKQALDALYAADLVVGKVGVFGYSLGASSAILHASKDDRVEAVVAVAPFRSLEHEAPDYLRGALPGVGALVPKSLIDAYVKQGAEVAGFSPDQATPEQAIATVAAPTLLLHGEDDTLIPVEHSIAIDRASGGKTTLVTLPGRGHLSIWVDKEQETSRYARIWFDRYLPAQPAFLGVPLPGEPAAGAPQFAPTQAGSPPLTSQAPSLDQGVALRPVAAPALSAAPVR